jgi:type IV pilus assembly protein PilY1
MRHRTNHKAAALAFLLAFLVASPASALSPTGPLNLVTSPLVNSSTSSVQPNIMFTLDDSGSMAWDFVPDWAGGASGVATSFNSITSAAGKPYIYHNAQYNGVAYDPSVTYTPPSYFISSGAPDATDSTATYPSMTGTTTSTGANSSTKPNWSQVKNDGYGKQSTGTVALTTTQVTTSNSNVQDNYLYNIPYYFTFIPGEYCSDQKQTTCHTQNAPDSGSNPTYIYPAYLRWCNSKALTTCQLLYSDTTGYHFPRWPGMGTTTSAITISAGGASQSITGITVNGYQIMSAATSASTSNTTIASRLAAVINCQYSMSGTCQTPGYTATSSGSTVTITSPSTGVTFTPVITYTGGTAPTAAAFTTGNASVNGQSISTPGANIFVPILPINNSYGYPGTSPSAKAATRTDCGTSTTCSYTQEMTNYANWYAYYHTRMQAMKTAVSQAFSTVGTNFRVGFNQISNQSGVTNGNKFLNPVTFNGTAKNIWYNMFFGINPSGSTPLRMAISKIGRFYANKLSGQTDPMQYSCQQNFSILSTDGYWNDTTNPVQLNGTTAVGDQDGGGTRLPYFEGSTKSSNSLADVAMYYYQTDLRNSSLSNCTGVLGADVCTNNVPSSTGDNFQHVTQFTLGLGVNGLLLYTKDYQTATSGDYYNLKNGFNNTTWGDPIGNDSEGRVDDLWHAAVNGRGIYFSAKNPSDILYGFTTALNAIQAVKGAGSGAATSTLTPVSGNNFTYTPSYTTVQWTGNIEERAIDLSSSNVVSSDTWCAEDVLASSACPSPGVVQSSSASTSNGTTTVYNCVTANSSTANCTGTLDSSNNCIVPMSTSCTGQMHALVGPSSDTRKIYMSNGGTSPTLVPFTYTNMSSTQQAYFGTSYLSSRLSQWVNYTTQQQTDAIGANLVNFLRGQNGHENRSANTEILYRARNATLGDIVNSQPTYVGKPVFAYADTGYASYVTAQSNRIPMLYVGANDGMLHAFNASTGVEQWAFVPTAIIPNMWALADMQYSTNHTYFVDGGIATSDVYDGTNWHTILVGGLGGGGRSYYALDITNPTSPKLLWEINSSQEPNLGYTYGRPLITKNGSGTWVVVFASGYNNINPGSGQGYIFVRNALTGAAISTISDSAGTTSVPSGLAKLSGWADNTNVNNTAQAVYGGDLMGNLWRFDINAGTSFLLAVLKDPSGNTQPITTVPELGSVSSRRVIYVGTGKYLELTDLSDTQQQSFYAIEDNANTTTLNNPRNSSQMVQQTATLNTSNGTYNVGGNGTVSFLTGLGWFFDFPVAGERVIVDPLLVNGRLNVATIIPSSTACAPGGFSNLYNLDYATGVGVSTTYSSSPIMGLGYYVLNGTVNLMVTTGDGQLGTSNGGNLGGGGAFGSSRVMWRELITQ